MHERLFCLTRERERKGETNSRTKYTGKTKNRRDSWDTMMWLCTEQRWKEKRTENAMPDWIRNCCYPSTIILFFVLRFVFAFIAEFTFFLLYTHVCGFIFLLVSFCALHIAFMPWTMSSLLFHFCVGFVSHAYYSYPLCQFLFMLLINFWMLILSLLWMSEWFNTILWAMTYET